MFTVHASPASALSSPYFSLQINWTHEQFRLTIFDVINKTMKGRWAETAMQETGSIICQNIFETADGEEKVSRVGSKRGGCGPVS